MLQLQIKVAGSHWRSASAVQFRRIRRQSSDWSPPTQVHVRFSTSHPKDNVDPGPRRAWGFASPAHSIKAAISGVAFSVEVRIVIGRKPAAPGVAEGETRQRGATVEARRQVAAGAPRRTGTGRIDRSTKARPRRSSGSCPDSPRRSCPPCTSNFHRGTGNRSIAARRRPRAPARSVAPGPRRPPTSGTPQGERRIASHTPMGSRSEVDIGNAGESTGRRRAHTRTAAAGGTSR